jgi:F-type H+-transporting ATPase subunit gamma
MAPAWLPWMVPRGMHQLIKKVTLYYNKTRQAAITKELMDIVGGAEALK